jgi:hypothetical protein
MLWLQNVRVSAGINDLITDASGRIELGVRRLTSVSPPSFAPIPGPDSNKLKEFRGLAGVGGLSSQNCVGLVGANGCGKSTLLRCLTGQREVNAGSLMIKEGVPVGYLEQTAVSGSTRSVWDEAKSAMASTLAEARVAHAQAAVEGAARTPVTIFSVVVPAWPTGRPRVPVRVSLVGCETLGGGVGRYGGGDSLGGGLGGDGYRGSARVEVRTGGTGGGGRRGRRRTCGACPGRTGLHKRRLARRLRHPQRRVCAFALCCNCSRCLLALVASHGSKHFDALYDMGRVGLT